MSLREAIYSLGLQELGPQSKARINNIHFKSKIPFFPAKDASCGQPLIEIVDFDAPYIRLNKPHLEDDFSIFTVSFSYFSL